VSGLTANPETRLNAGAPIVEFLSVAFSGIQGVQSGVEVIAVPPAYKSNLPPMLEHWVES